MQILQEKKILISVQFETSFKSHVKIYKIYKKRNTNFAKMEIENLNLIEEIKSKSTKSVPRLCMLSFNRRSFGDIGTFNQTGAFWMWSFYPRSSVLKFKIIDGNILQNPRYYSFKIDMGVYGKVEVNHIKKTEHKFEMVALIDLPMQDDNNSAFIINDTINIKTHAVIRDYEGKSEYSKQESNEDYEGRLQRAIQNLQRITQQNRRTE